MKQEQRTGKSTECSGMLKLAVIIGLGLAILRVATTSAHSTSVSVTPSAAVGSQNPVSEPASPWDYGSGGRWQFAGISWRLARREVPGDELTKEFDAVPSASTINADGTHALPDRIRDLLEQQTTVEQKAAGFAAYGLKQEGFLARVFTVGESMQICCWRIAWPAGEFAWTIVEGTFDTKDIANTKNILPYPPETQPVASRFDDSGRVRLEFVDTPFPQDALLDSWQAAGWRIEEAPQQTGLAGMVWLTKKSAQVQVWFNTTSDARCHLIVTQVTESSVQTGEHK